MEVVGVEIHPRLVACFVTIWSDVRSRISWHFCCQSELLLSPPADGLLLISDACLPESPVGLLQAEGNSPLQVIFIVPRQVNHICMKTHSNLFA